MILVMQRDATEAHIEAVVKRIREHGLDVNISRGTERTLIGAIGDERKLDQEQMEALAEKHDRPYVKATRDYLRAFCAMNDVEVAAGDVRRAPVLYENSARLFEGCGEVELAIRSRVGCFDVIEFLFGQAQRLLTENMLA